jgi:[acyl-carrier-protein] S-malonyltransferase
MSGKVAFVFPGQGAQEVGMGQAWAEAYPEARAAFEEADRVLPGLEKICWEGPAEELQLTANTQPAILATSVAILRVLETRHPGPAVVAGHSLGEYSALVASGALAFDDALRLVRRRGELMQEAVPVGEGAMAAILGLEAAAVEEVAEAATEGDELCDVANYNDPKQTVVAGHQPAVERAVALAKERGARRAQLLAVSAPFHSALMRPAREGLAPLLQETRFEDPRVPVVVNVDARPVTSGDEARDALVRQVDQSVRWVASVEWMVREGGVESFVEVGPGRVLAGLIRRISRETPTVSLFEPSRLGGLLEEGESGQ